MHKAVSTDSRPIKAVLLRRLYNPGAAFSATAGQGITAVTVAGRKKSLIDSLTLGGAARNGLYLSDIGKLALLSQFNSLVPTHRDFVLPSALQLVPNFVQRTPTQTDTMCGSGPANPADGANGTNGTKVRPPPVSAWLPYRLIVMATQ